DGDDGKCKKRPCGSIARSLPEDQCTNTEHADFEYQPEERRNGGFQRCSPQNTPHLDWLLIRRVLQLDSYPALPVTVLHGVVRRRQVSISAKITQHALVLRPRVDLVWSHLPNCVADEVRGGNRASLPQILGKGTGDHRRKGALEADFGGHVNVPHH